MYSARAVTLVISDTLIVRVTYLLTYGRKSIQTGVDGASARRKDASRHRYDVLISQRGKGYL